MVRCKWVSWPEAQDRWGWWWRWWRLWLGRWGWGCSEANPNSRTCKRGLHFAVLWCAVMKIHHCIKYGTLESALVCRHKIDCFLLLTLLNRSLLDHYSKQWECCQPVKCQTSIKHLKTSLAIESQPSLTQREGRSVKSLAMVECLVTCGFLHCSRPISSCLRRGIHQEEVYIESYK